MPERTNGGSGAVLLAVDGSEFGVGATRVAIALSARCGVPLLALHVLTSGGEEGVMGLDARAVERAEARVGLERIAEEARRAGVDARPMTRNGSSAADVIVAAADEAGAGVIVVGRRGRTGFARGSLGHTTTRVIGAASCPVLVAPRAAELWTRTILLAADGSPASEAATLCLGRWSAAAWAPIVVLSVEVPTHSPERRAEAAQIVERTVAALSAAGRDAEGKVASGLAAEEIVRAASETRADLVVLGSEGRTGLGRALLGSNSQAVISRVACAAMVVTARMARNPAMLTPSSTTAPPAIDPRRP
jgi:nucleotide-binding universal stress UspA family protein